MGTSFVNRCTHTREHIAEFIYTTFSRVYQGVTIALGVLFIALGFFFLLSGQPVMLAVNLALAVFLFVYPLILRRRVVGKRYKTELLFNNGQEVQAITEFSERIRLLSPDKGERYFDYGQITRIDETPHLLILRLGRLAGIMLAKDGFFVGSLEGFRPFIREKCPKVRCAFL